MTSSQVKCNFSHEQISLGLIAFRPFIYDINKIGTVWNFSDLSTFVNISYRVSGWDALSFFHGRKSDRFRGK